MKISYEGMRLQDVTYQPETDQWTITMTADNWPWIMKQAKTIRCKNCGSRHVHKDGNYIKGGKRYECQNCKTYFIVRD